MENTNEELNAAALDPIMAEDVEQEQPEQSGVDVTQLMFDSLVIIEESINRGTFKANELSGVMRVYDQLSDLKKQITEQGAK